MKLDVDYVRAQFPAFAQESLKDQAFFENAGGSYTAGAVIDRLSRYYRERKVQPYAPYAASQAAGAEMDEARAGLARWLGVDTDEVSFGPSTSQNTYVLAQAFRSWLNPGDTIIVTNQDHEANTGPWRRLADDGITIREWRIDPETGRLDPDDLANLLDDSVRLVCFPHCSNVVGEINPVSEITALAHAAGAFTCVDGVSYASHGLPNVASLGADIYLFSSYKTYGPHQGIMVMRKGLGELLPNQAHFFNGDVLYKRFTPAGPDHAQVAACAGIVDYFEDLAAHHNISGPVAQKSEDIHHLLRDHETRLLQPLLDALATKNSVRVLGPNKAAHRAPTVAIATQSDPHLTATQLAERGIMAGAGDFYAVRALQGQGVSSEKGVLRVSFVHYTSKAEIDKLILALDELL
ncbi:aminotransferase class V-fold PLP-dependent enzyme [Cognatishimia sp. WU-CL00825]|uniref:aminotransferase class V-fold PLP-dependent enzyme n=1 Tax=Cognatishimia sp. WU-CL00825 TaxID=3127658 RepID=UPI0031063966